MQTHRRRPAESAIRWEHEGGACGGGSDTPEHGYADNTFAYWYDSPGGGVGTLHCRREQGTLTR